MTCFLLTFILNVHPSCLCWLITSFTPYRSSHQAPLKPIICLHRTCPSDHLLSHQLTSRPLWPHPYISSLIFLQTSCLPVAVSESLYWYIHCPSSGHIQTISVWLHLQHIQHVLSFWCSDLFCPSMSKNHPQFHLCFLSSTASKTMQLFFLLFFLQKRKMMATKH